MCWDGFIPTRRKQKSSRTVQRPAAGAKAPDWKTQRRRTPARAAVRMCFPIARLFYGRPVETAAPYSPRYIGTIFILLSYSVRRQCASNVFAKKRSFFYVYFGVLHKFSQVDFPAGQRQHADGANKKTASSQIPFLGAAAAAPVPRKTFAHWLSPGAVCAAAAAVRWHSGQTPSNTMSCSTSEKPVSRMMVRFSRPRAGTITS